VLSCNDGWISISPPARHRTRHGEGHVIANEKEPTTTTTLAPGHHRRIRKDRGDARNRCQRTPSITSTRSQQRVCYVPQPEHRHARALLPLRVPPQPAMPNRYLVDTCNSASTRTAFGGTHAQRKTRPRPKSTRRNETKRREPPSTVPQKGCFHSLVLSSTNQNLSAPKSQKPKSQLPRCVEQTHERLDPNYSLVDPPKPRARKHHVNAPATQSSAPIDHPSSFRARN